jgi:hypothetical protein
LQYGWLKEVPGDEKTTEKQETTLPTANRPEPTSGLLTSRAALSQRFYPISTSMGSWNRLGMADDGWDHGGARQCFPAAVDSEAKNEKYSDDASTRGTCATVASPRTKIGDCTHQIVQICCSLISFFCAARNGSVDRFGRRGTSSVSTCGGNGLHRFRLHISFQNIYTCGSQSGWRKRNHRFRFLRRNAENWSAQIPPLCHPM